jgi:peptidoglycan hydrolase-like protein with peptidoglycan-binding domain
MFNFLTGLIFLTTLAPNTLNANCLEYGDNHPVKSDIMMQIVLKSYGYYEGVIDGKFGKISKKSLVMFQNNNNIDADGSVGPQTCNLLLKKNKILSNKSLKINIENTNVVVPYSQDIYDAQVILKDLGLYTSVIDGINGPGTKRALKTFQTKSGLNSDGVLGPLTKSALSKGEDSYVQTVTNNTEQPKENSTTQSTEVTYGIDLRNYDPSKPCINGYVDSSGIWVPDPCFKPVFVYRFGNTAQVNSQQELDAYLADRW